MFLSGFGDIASRIGLLSKLFRHSSSSSTLDRFPVEVGNVVQVGVGGSNPWLVCFFLLFCIDTPLPFPVLPFPIFVFPISLI